MPRGFTLPPGRRSTGRSLLPPPVHPAAPGAGEEWEAHLPCEAALTGGLSGVKATQQQGFLLAFPRMGTVKTKQVAFTHFIPWDSYQEQLKESLATSTICYLLQNIKIGTVAIHFTEPKCSHSKKSTCS